MVNSAMPAVGSQPVTAVPLAEDRYAIGQIRPSLTTQGRFADLLAIVDPQRVSLPAPGRRVPFHDNIYTQDKPLLAAFDCLFKRGLLDAPTVPMSLKEHDRPADG
jgi:hypothetical protein